MIVNMDKALQNNNDKCDILNICRRPQISLTNKWWRQNLCARLNILTAQHKQGYFNFSECKKQKQKILLLRQFLVTLQFFQSLLLLAPSHPVALLPLFWNIGF